MKYINYGLAKSIIAWTRKSLCVIIIIYYGKRSKNPLGHDPGNKSTTIINFIGTNIYYIGYASVDI